MVFLFNVEQRKPFNYHTPSQVSVTAFIAAFQLLIFIELENRLRYEFMIFCDETEN